MIARYLFLAHLGLTLKVLAFVLLALSLGQFADALQFVRGSSDVPAFTVLWQAMLRTPSLLQYALPHVIILATVLLLHRLGAQRELAIMAGAGQAARNLLMPLALSGAVLGAGYVLVVNPLASAALQEADRLDRQELQLRSPDDSRNIAIDRDDGTLFVFADGVLEDGTQIGPTTVIEITPNYRVRRRADFDRAELGPNGRWTVENYRESDGIGTELAVAPPQSPPFDPEMLTRRLPERHATSVYQLRETAAFAEMISAQPLPFQFQLHWLLALPFFLGAVCYLSGSVSLYLAFQRSWGRRALEVLALAFPLYALITVTEALAIRGIVPPLAAALAAPSMIFILGFVIARVRGI